MVSLSIQSWKVFRFLFHPHQPHPAKPEINPTPSAWEQEGVVDEPIRPHHEGRVYFRGTWWPARCLEDLVLTAGETVRITGWQNITLIVEPFSHHY